jgi:hypothetical protein
MYAYTIKAGGELRILKRYYSYYMPQFSAYGKYKVFRRNSTFSSAKRGKVLTRSPYIYNLVPYIKNVRAASQPSEAASLM